MEKKLVKVGSSWGMIIPPSLLSVIGVDQQKTKFKITLKERSVIITPVDKES